MSASLLALGALILALAVATVLMWPRQRELDGVQKYSDVAEDETDGGNSAVDPVEVGIGLDVDNAGH